MESFQLRVSNTGKCEFLLPREKIRADLFQLPPRSERGKNQYCLLLEHHLNRFACFNLSLADIAGALSERHRRTDLSKYCLGSCPSLNMFFSTHVVLITAHNRQYPLIRKVKDPSGSAQLRCDVLKHRFLVHWWGAIYVLSRRRHICKAMFDLLRICRAGEVFLDKIQSQGNATSKFRHITANYKGDQTKPFRVSDWGWVYDLKKHAVWRIAVWLSMPVTYLLPRIDGSGNPQKDGPCKDKLAELPHFVIMNSVTKAGVQWMRHGYEKLHMKKIHEKILDKL
jgi:hypothetical protein